MKLLKLMIPLLVLASLSLMLAGCPKSDKMMQNEGTAPVQSVLPA